jgi:hypothetical protein
VDTLVGSDKGDLFEGIVGASSTLTALDSIDGKEGKDTLNILNAASAALELPAGLVVKNVEIVNVRSADDVGAAAAGNSFDVSGFTGLTDLNITQATAAYLKAAATTDVIVSGVTGDITVTDGKNVVVIGSSDIVGKPMASLLINAKATVTVCNSRTKDLKAHTLAADIVVIAVGVPFLLKDDMVKDGAVVIDVGINRLETGKLVGDADFESLKEKCSHLTPVPGGVGPMTIAMLMNNCVHSVELQK